MTEASKAPNAGSVRSRGRATGEEASLRLSRRGWITALGAIGGSALVSCCSDTASLGSSSIPPPRTPGAPVLVLVILDGVRGEEALSTLGGAPWLQHLAVIEGCHLGGPDCDMFASGPDYVSLPGYAEIFTGSRRAGCPDNGCRSLRARTLLEDFAAQRDTPEGEVALVGSWPELERVAARDHLRGVVSVGRSSGHNHRLLHPHPKTRRALALGRRGAPEPGCGDYRPDTRTAELAIAYLVEVGPRLLVVSLGDADEHAHRGAFHEYREAIAFADTFVGAVHRQLKRFELEGASTALLVTTDHGRAKDLVEHGAAWPESARTWLVASGSLIRGRGPIRSPLPTYLADIAPTLRELGGVPAPAAPAAGRILWELGLDPGPRRM